MIVEQEAKVAVVRECAIRSLPKSLAAIQRCYLHTSTALMLTVSLAILLTLKFKSAIMDTAVILAVIVTP